jgi:hypothetical protein
LIEILAERTEQKPNATDAAAERETIITWSDADNVISISTGQQRKITELLNNPSAVLVERDTEANIYQFELPLNLITIRKGKRAANKSGVVRKGRPANIKLCGEPTAKGTPCQGIAKLDTGKCAKHS